MLKAPRGLELVVIVWMVCLTLYFVNDLRMYDVAAKLRVEQQSAHYRQALQTFLARDSSSLCPQPAVPPRAAVHITGKPKIALLILCYNRPSYMEKTMNDVLKYIPGENFPVIISQDGNAPEMREFLVSNYGQVATLLQNHPRVKEFKGPLMSYHYIAQHYFFALSKAFDVMKFDTVVILEDDMQIAPDFFLFFEALAPRLHADTSLLCVSAWNDNGLRDWVSEDESRGELRRTNVFPGLGWMLTRSLWEELRVKWPSGFWDDWLREPDQHQGRDCIFPTISRTRTFGAIGSSNGQFYDKYLTRIVLNDAPVDWAAGNFDHLERETFRMALRERVSKARTVSMQDVRVQAYNANDDIRCFYDNAKQYERIATSLHIMEDLKAGSPRSSFDGVVALHLKTAPENYVFLVPTNYNMTLVA